MSTLPAGTDLLVTGEMIAGSRNITNTAFLPLGDITVLGKLTNTNPGTDYNLEPLGSVGDVYFGPDSVITLNSGNGVVLMLFSTASTGRITTDGKIVAPTGAAMRLVGTTVNGDVTNNGTGDFWTYYLRGQAMTLNGDLTNNGTISSTRTTVQGYGFRLQRSVVNGNITNAGTMTGKRGTDGVLVTAGIRMERENTTDSALTGTILNSGTISGFDAGVFLTQSTVGEDIVNSGTMRDLRHGISLATSGTVTELSNSGTITVSETGMTVSGDWTIRGGISNRGRIDAGQDGVSLTGTTLRGGILNTGTVSAGRFGFALANAGAISTFDNFGTISGTTSGISATGSTQIGTLTNAQGAGNAAGGVTYSGTLPTNYHTVIDGTAYGQLFADPATLTGTTTFAISPLSGTVLAQTYSTVLTGVSAANLSNPDQKVYLFGERGSLVLERQAGSDTTWDLVLKGIWTPFIGWDYPDVDPTVAAMASNREAINRIFAERSAALSAAAQYDCDRFDVHGICVEIAGRATTLDGEAETAAVVNAAARLTPTLRMGFYLDQQASQTDSMVASGSGSVQQDYDMPLFGAYLGYAAAEDGTGLKARASAGYMAGKLDIRRGFLTQSEPASGSAALEAFYAQATLGYGFLIGRDMRLTPYVGLDYTALDRDGYSEAYDASETLFPVTYDSYHDRLLSGLAGVELEGQFNEDVGYRAALGLAFDLTRDANGYGGHSEIPGLETIDLGHDGGSRAEVRPTGLAELFFDPAPNQRISATAFAAQDAWSEDLQATGMIAYRFSF